MANHILRKALPGDSKHIADCIDAAYAIYKDRVPDLPNVSDDISTAIATKDVWVSECKGNIVGVMVLVELKNCMALENIAVHPDSAGKGIGKALIQRVESECMKLGLSEIRLSTHRDITENISLYQHLGWRTTHTEDNKVHMRKTV